MPKDEEERESPDRKWFSWRTKSTVWRRNTTEVRE